jgi:8-oxo-dGTP pyrophosphatase MutT (NUDIX family)
MVREAREEAGIILQKENLEVGCVMNRKAEKYEYIDYFFIARSYL